MHWSELAGRDIINLEDGARLGRVGDCDVVFDPVTGRIASLILPTRGRWFHWFGPGPSVTIPWEAIRRVGPEVVLVEFSQTPGFQTSRQRGSWHPF